MNRWHVCFLLWLVLLPLTALGSGLLAGWIAAHLIAGIEYFPSQDPGGEAVWWAMFITGFASLCFIIFSPMVSSRLLKEDALWGGALVSIVAHAIILLISAALSLYLVFGNGIPKGIPQM